MTAQAKAQEYVGGTGANPIQDVFVHRVYGAQSVARMRLASVPATPPAQSEPPEVPESPIQPEMPDNPDLPPDPAPPEIIEPPPDVITIPVREPPVMPPPID